MRRLGRVKVASDPTPNEIARQVVKWAESGVVHPPEPESVVLAYAFLAAAEAWRDFNQPRLDEVLLAGEPDA
jgi:hypothetical protein